MKKYKVTIDDTGTERWFKDGSLHRDDDKPAIIWFDGSQTWYKDGNLHRDGDKPAIIWFNGDKEWWVDGKLHRDGDQPAIIYADGSKEWWKDGFKILKEEAKNSCTNKSYEDSIITIDGVKYKLIKV